MKWKSATGWNSGRVKTQRQAVTKMGEGRDRCLQNGYSGWWNIKKIHKFCKDLGSEVLNSMNACTLKKKIGKLFKCARARDVEELIYFSKEVFHCCRHDTSEPAHAHGQ